MKQVKILETTLRDGSYAVDFSFTTSDTALIARALESAGFEFIEIGHGVGLNASNMGHGRAVHTDEEYLAAVSQALTKAKFGMFCIPGVAELKDVDLAAKYKMGFIRIGTNVTEVEQSEKFIQRAKESGMFVASNFMKSYALKPREFAQKALLSEKYGADMVYIVDSAGSMFAEDVKAYYEAIREVSNIPVGFHGHDNLGLAVANSLEAAKIGIGFVDSSLQGLGRSAGNASTEALVAALLKLGFSLGIDFIKVLEIGQKYVRPLISSRGTNPLDVVAGYAGFHSSYMKYVQKYAAKYSVNPALLIIELCKVDKVNLDEARLEAIAQKLHKEAQLYLGDYNFNRYVGSEQDK